ncbi:MAG TPA: VOC family protein [Acidimicrobiales bacterium]|nr:VOC family protein [Acidimicrobiales bacterium]
MWLRLRQVALVASSLSRVVDDLNAVFGLEVGFRDPGVARFGLENAVIPVGSQFLEVVAPTRPGTAGGRLLERRHGDGGYMVITHCDDHPRRRERVTQLGIRTVLEFEEQGYRCMQLHPKDTGGSFLEIDWQEGGEDPDGPWAPAGPDWKRAVRTDVVDGISAVEVQAVEYARVASRWSEIVEIALRRGDHDSPEIALDNATIRFAPALDGRGDGLAGVELLAVDADSAMRSARQRDLLDDRGVIMIGGTRFSLRTGG